MERNGWGIRAADAKFTIGGKKLGAFGHAMDQFDFACGHGGNALFVITGDGRPCGLPGGNVGGGTSAVWATIEVAGGTGSVAWGIAYGWFVVGLCKSDVPGRWQRDQSNDQREGVPTLPGFTFGGVIGQSGGLRASPVVVYAALAATGGFADANFDLGAGGGVDHARRPFARRNAGAGGDGFDGRTIGQKYFSADAFCGYQWLKCKLVWSLVRAGCWSAGTDCASGRKAGGVGAKGRSVDCGQRGRPHSGGAGCDEFSASRADERWCWKHCK